MEKEVPKNPLSKLFSAILRYNLVIFIVITVAGLAVSVLVLNRILRLPYSTGSTTVDNSSITFDETTLSQIDSLKTSDKNTANQPVPSGRINPFSE